MGKFDLSSSKEGRVEGDGKGENIWDYWYEIEPEKFHNEIGPERHPVL